jgi:hypothetical protein
MRKLILITLVLLMTACAGKKKPEDEQTLVVTSKVVKPHVVTIDQSLLVDCNVTPPPDKDIYMKSSMVDRESMLTQVMLRNYKNLGDCNIRLRAARAQQEKIKRM